MSPQILFKDIDEPGLATLAVYERRGGYAALRTALTMEPEAIVAEIEASGLRGRGGAGFPAGRKSSFLPKGDIDKYLVCNADESEPGTFKDRELMQKCPHALIEGVVIAARGAGITRAFIYIRGEYEAQARILDAALAEATRGRLHRRADHGLATSPARLVLHRGAGAYICGEETGLLDSLEGKRGNPRLKPPFPAIEGLYHGPTLINNVETLMTMPRDHPHGRRRVRQARRAELGGHEGRLGLGARAAARQLRDRARHPLARDHLRPRRRPAARAARSSCGSRAGRARRS